MASRWSLLGSNTSLWITGRLGRTSTCFNWKWLHDTAMFYRIIHTTIILVYTVLKLIIHRITQNIRLLFVHCRVVARPFIIVELYIILVRIKPVNHVVLIHCNFNVIQNNVINHVRIIGMKSKQLNGKNELKKVVGHFELLNIWARYLG